MTEAEWLASDDPDEVWAACDWAGRERKAILWAAACCDRAAHLLWEPTHELVAEIIVWAEADPVSGLPPAGEFRAAMDAILAAPQSPARYANRTVTSLINGPSPSIARGLASALASERTGLPLPAFNGQDPPAEWIAARKAELAAQAALLRDVTGTPFREQTFDPAWQSATVRRLAEVVYADRAWDRLPIMADALEEAGCADPHVLAHLRGSGPHARGCWVVDLVLGKG